jgi:hypothetical protein
MFGAVSTPATVAKDDRGVIHGPRSHRHKHRRDRRRRKQLLRGEHVLSLCHNKRL